MLRLLLACAIVASGLSAFGSESKLTELLRHAPELRGWTWSKNPTMIPSGFRPGPGDALILHETLAKDGSRFELIATRYATTQRLEASLKFLENTSQRYTAPVSVNGPIPNDLAGVFFRRGNVLLEMYVIPPIKRGKPVLGLKPALAPADFRHLLRRLLQAV